MGVVLGFPPLDRESLEEIADNDTSEITICSILEYLMVEKIVREPTTSLPKETKNQCTNHMNHEGIRKYHTCNGGTEQHKIRDALPCVIDWRGIEHASCDELCAKVTISLLK